MKTFVLNEIRLAKLYTKVEQNLLVLVFGYDKIEQKAVCGRYSTKEKRLCLLKVSLKELTIFNTSEDIIMNQNENEEIMKFLTYLTNVGLDLPNWNPDWSINDWNLLTKY